MLTLKTAQNVDLWEAWIDMQVPGQFGGGTLFVIGDIVVGEGKLEPLFFKRAYQGPDPSVLLLEVRPNILVENGRVAEIMYSEELDSPAQYREVVVYAGGEIIARLDEIEHVL
ncbi:MAG TPA: hypothetical protein VHK69_17235 [Chitinophagaceae bacterium]|nr:hypothetical protein [Chitinophagaceae bacterium]